MDAVPSSLDEASRPPDTLLDNVLPDPCSRSGHRERQFRKTSRVEAVATALRERLLNGELAPGSPLREAELTETYGVARHGVRAALHKLAQEGLLRHEPHRGVFVPQFTENDVADLHGLRMAIELEAVRIVCEQKLSLDGIRTALANLEALPQDAPWGQLAAADLRIHEAIVGVVNSPMISRTYNSLLGELRLCLAFLSVMPGRRNELRREHREIFKALVARNSKLAIRIMRDHLTEASTNIGTAIRESDVSQPRDSRTAG